MVHGGGGGKKTARGKAMMHPDSKVNRPDVCCTIPKKNGTETHLLGNKQQTQRPSVLGCDFPVDMFLQPWLMRD